MLIIIFGLAAAGKSYVGALLEAQFSMRFLDADLLLTPAMRRAVMEGRSFSHAMQEELINLMIERITSMQQEASTPIAVAQGLYRQWNRTLLEGAFPEAVWIEVRCPEVTWRRRLQQRNDFVSLEYAQHIAPYFESSPAGPGHFIVVNQEEGEQSLIAQLRSILG